MAYSRAESPRDQRWPHPEGGPAKRDDGTVADSRRDDHFLPLAAVRALYRSCHLTPPAVLVPDSAVAYARTVAIAGRVGQAQTFTCVSLCALSFLILFLGTADLIAWWRAGQTPPPFAVAVLAYLATVAVGFAGWYFRVLAQPRTKLADLVLGYAPCVLIGLALGVGLGGGWTILVTATALGAATAVLLHATRAVLAPLGARLRLRRRYRAAVPLRGSPSIHDAMRTRLAAAIEQVLTAPNAGRRQAGGSSEHGVGRRDMALRLEAEGRRLVGFRWYELRPLLGTAVGTLDRTQLERTGRAVADLEDLPAVLQAALTLHVSVDAATLLERVAIILPRNAPAEIRSAAPAGTTRPRLRSRRTPYRETFAALGASPALRLLVDLAGSDRRADRLLARHLIQIEDRINRHALIRTMGLERVVTAAGLEPVQTDDAGALYVIGSAQDPLALVKVAGGAEDEVPGAHWLSVPPHAASAREGLAWTFGLSERAYFPADEA
jgi:hypothetical protein